MKLEKSVSIVLFFLSIIGLILLEIIPYMFDKPKNEYVIFLVSTTLLVSYMMSVGWGWKHPWNFSSIGDLFDFLLAPIAWLTIIQTVVYLLYTEELFQESFLHHVLYFVGLFTTISYPWYKKLFKKESEYI